MNDIFMIQRLSTDFNDVLNDEWCLRNEEWMNDFGKGQFSTMKDKWVFSPKNERMIECSWAIPNVIYWLYWL